MLDVFKCSATISKCGKRQQWQHALDVFSLMSVKRFQIDMVCVNSAVSACQRSCRWEQVVLLVEVALKSWF